MIKNTSSTALLLCGMTFVVAGCNKTDNSTANYKAAVNDYYKGASCLFVAGGKEISRAGGHFG